MREKQILYKRLAEAEKNPFFLHPHQHPVFPFLHFPTNTKCNLSSVTPSPPFYPLLQQQQHSPPKGPLTPFPTPESASSTRSSNPATTPAPNTNISATPPRPSYPSQFYPSFVKYPFSPQTPSNLGSFGLLSPWTPNSVAATTQTASTQAINSTQHLNSAPTSSTSVRGVTSTPREGSSGIGNASTSMASSHQPLLYHTAASTPTVWQTIPTTSSSSSSSSSSTTALPHLMSPHFTSVQSPLSYFHPSPLSPMMYLQSPYASSVSSCPSISSSSGCSSDGGNATTSQTKQYAPSEYYVGPMRPLSEKIADEDNQSEGATNSGRNTPNDISSDDSGTVMSTDMGVAQNLIVDSTTANSSMSAVTPLGAGVHFGSNLSDAMMRRPSQQGRSHGRHVRSPYPFSAESLSSSQPSSVGSNSHVSQSSIVYLHTLKMSAIQYMIFLVHVLTMPYMGYRLFI